MTHIPLHFDVVEAFTITFLQGRGLRYTRTVYNPILVLFKMMDKYPEDFGSISLRRIDDTTTDITFGNPSRPMKTEVFDLIQQNSEAMTEAYRRMKEAIQEDLRIKDPQILKDEAAVSIYAAANFLYKKRLDSHQKIASAYVEKLIEENPSINTPPEPGPNEISFDMAAKETRPWEHIPDHLWDREAVKLFCQGYTNTEIGRVIKISPRRVTNRISELRKQYPFIPTNAQRWKRMMGGDS